MNNPPAFPRPASEYRENGVPVDTTRQQDGMTLRDYFAAAALTGLLSDYRTEDVPFEAYKLADAMLAEREAKR